jgi:hypothetical protein
MMFNPSGGTLTMLNLIAYYLKPEIPLLFFRDFQKVPLIEKKTYLFKYPLPERCIGGSIFPGSIE